MLCRSGLLPALTADNRTVWAQFRLKHLAEGTNRASLDAIERAVCDWIGVESEFSQFLVARSSLL